MGTLSQNLCLVRGNDCSPVDSIMDSTVWSALRSIGLTIDLKCYSTTKVEERGRRSGIAYGHSIKDLEAVNRPSRRSPR